MRTWQEEPLIKPSAIDTPYVRHAKNYMEVEPVNPPPVYAPETVAEAILHCAEHPERDVTVGGGGRVLAALGQHAPRLTDRFMELTMFRQQRTDRPSGQEGTGGNGSSLHRPSNDLAERGGYPGHVAESSMYTKATLHPFVTAATVIGAAGLAVAGVIMLAGEGRMSRSRWV